MSRRALFILYFLVYILLSQLSSGLDYRTGSWGDVFALVFGGIIFAGLGMLVEPLLNFFKLPSNFWGMFLLGFILNAVLFLGASSGVFAQFLLVGAGSFGGSAWAPFPMPLIAIASVSLNAVWLSFLGTLLQQLARALSL